jgi:enoyl-CoA hydratase/carnithine racemase
VSQPQDELVVERRDAVLVARINRPDARNALTPAVITGLADAVSDAEQDPDLRAVVITGTGDRAFCAGMDLRAFASGDQIALDAGVMERFFALLEGRATIPVIGAANGTAVGGGLELLLGCDIVVASSDAKFGLPEVKRGLLPAGSGYLLGTRVPLGIALEMVLTGDSIDAARANALGLVNAVVAPGDVMAAALGYAERIAANGPLGVQAMKELVRLGVADPARAAARLREVQSVIFGSEDAKEGALAFVERRPPVFRGR